MVGWGRFSDLVIAGLGDLVIAGFGDLVNDGFFAVAWKMPEFWRDASRIACKDEEVWI